MLLTEVSFSSHEFRIIVDIRGTGCLEVLLSVAMLVTYSDITLYDSEIHWNYR